MSASQRNGRRSRCRARAARRLRRRADSASMARSASRCARALRAQARRLAAASSGEIAEFDAVASRSRRTVPARSSRSRFARLPARLRGLFSERCASRPAARGRPPAAMPAAAPLARRCARASSSGTASDTTIDVFGPTAGARERELARSQPAPFEPRDDRLDGETETLARERRYQRPAADERSPAPRAAARRRSRPPSSSAPGQRADERHRLALEAGRQQQRDGVEDRRDVVARRSSARALCVRRRARRARR